MELVFNELSTGPKRPDRTLADLHMHDFITTYKSAHGCGYNRIRFPLRLHEINIAEGYNLSQWLNSNASKTHKDLLLSAYRYPFIEDSDTPQIEGFLEANFYVMGVACQGLAAAYLYGTLSISLQGNIEWEKNILRLTRQIDAQVAEEFDVNNVFSAKCFEQNAISEFVANRTPVVLIKTPMKPAQKPVHLRDDHGNDVLKPFAAKLKLSPFVVSVVNSTEWQPHFPHFVRKVAPNGIIEIVLFWDDRGLGLAIQTTGRNLPETKQIAEILEKKFAPRR